MTLARFSAAQPITGPSGRASVYLLGWLSELVSAVNASTTPVNDPAHSGCAVIAAGGLQGGGGLDADVGIALYRTVSSVAQLPSAGNRPGDWAYALDGRKPGEIAGAGTGVPVFWSHTTWFSVCGAPVAA